MLVQSTILHRWSIDVEVDEIDVLCVQRTDLEQRPDEK